MKGRTGLFECWRKGGKFVLVKMEVPQRSKCTAQSLASSYFSEYCVVNKMNEETGSDFFCVLPANETRAGNGFYLHFSEGENLEEEEDALSFQVTTAAVRHWLQKRRLTYFIHADVEKQELYWVDPFPQIFEKVRELSSAQETVVLKVPKSNVFSKEEEKLPDAFLESIDTFDGHLFNGTLKRISEDIETFSELTSFSEKPLVEETNQTMSIKYKNISLTAIYPDPQDAFFQGSCTIQLTRLKKKGEADITLGHRELLDLFYFGKGTDVHLGMRKYVRLYLEELDHYFVDFGNSVTYLYEEEVEELSVVIDFFIKRYVAKITSYLNDLKSFGFEPYQGSHRKFMLMTLTSDLWEKIRTHAKDHPTSKGSYEEGYMYIPFEDKNQIGIEDEAGLELFNVYGYYKQDKNDPEKMVVEVVWESLDSSADQQLDSAYSVADTYSFFMNDLLPRFFVSEETVPKKGLFRTKQVKVQRNQTKEEIERELVLSSYRLSHYPDGNAELADTFQALSEYMIEKEFYTINYKSFEKLLEQFDTLLRPELSIGGDNAKAWYLENKGEALDNVAQLKEEQENQTFSEGYFLAELFLKLQTIVLRYQESFDGKRIRESELLHDFSELINEYNEDRLIRLLD